MAFAVASVVGVVLAVEPRSELVCARSGRGLPLCGRPLFAFGLERVLALGLRRTHVAVLGDRLEEVRADIEALGWADRVSVSTLAAVPAQLVDHAVDAVLVVRGDAPLVELDELRVLLDGKGDEVALDAVLVPLQTGERSGAISNAADSLLGRSGQNVPSVLVRDLEEHASAESTLYARRARALRRSGVVVRGRVRVDASVECEPGATIEEGVTLRGATRICAGALVDVGAVLTDTVVGPHAIVKPYTVATRTTIGERTEVGPFSHLRLDTRLGPDVRVGNFVETKNVVMDRGAMANHLAYLGDGFVGERANISAGTIFCNSDGINKHRTEVGARAFVGTDCQLVAPVKIGEGAFVATGTTVTGDVPADALAISRSPQVNKEGYAVKLRERFAAIKAERDGSRD